MTESETTVIDASNLIVGRLASIVAKRLLSGDRIIIVNAEKAVVSGNKQSILKEAKAQLEIRTLGTKKRSPKHPRTPEGIVRRKIRGMLPMDKPKGKKAYKQLKVYSGIPSNLKEVNLQTLSKAYITNTKTSLTSVGEISKNIGWNPIW